jgi:predicted MFS family arabinose efflux permease
MFSMFLYLTLYLQNSLGYSPLQAGLRFLPVSLLSFVVAPISGRLSARVPMRGLIGGGLIVVGGGLALMHGLDASSGWTDLLPGFIVAGIGIGMVNPPLASTAIGVVEPRRSGMASGINNTFRQVGIATGTAAYGAVFQHLLKVRVVDALGHGPGGAAVRHLPVAAYSQGAPGPLARLPGGTHAYLGAFTSSLNVLLAAGAVVAALGGLGALALIRGRDLQAERERERAPAQEGAPAPAGSRAS